jgi:hypothetical protein
MGYGRHPIRRTFCRGGCGGAVSCGGGMSDKKCEWREDGDGNWATGCDSMFTFTDAGPAENEFKFCPYCGGRLHIKNEPDS